VLLQFVVALLKRMDGWRELEEQDLNMQHGGI